MLAKNTYTYKCVSMVNLLDKISYQSLVFASILLGLAPFVPEPHSIEKIRMLMAGELVKLIDVFDLVFHTFPFILIVVKLLSSYLSKKITVKDG